MIDKSDLWIIIFAMGIGSFGLRFLFLGLVGDRPLPPWVLRHLRYTAVAVLPGLVAPLVLWPAATNGQPDPARMIAALVTFAVGYATKNVLAAIFAGAGTLFLGLYFLG
ncbi:branched-subunit amino acid transport protein [Shimia isoporae]|uniref:Branched-subunit amino acid transport protein n=1 Tax=Shimia isoporae TaxID=647720 RepID=A0A4R1NJV9_9RHOB|nr:AzlD domain-containing protein [Shimia isoporae]TCL08484.1 branched-subunit amino acid transport protein [Shimia isoporae]